MSDDDTKVPLPDLENGGDVQVVPDGGTLVPSDSESVNRAPPTSKRRGCAFSA